MPGPWLSAAGSVLSAMPHAAPNFTNNILITGYWPETNNMVRQFSTNTGQNPSGWQGGNWEGRGYDIHSYFPEFPDGQINGSWGRGVGDFEVDYQDTHNDWLRIVEEVKPVAIITFSRGGSGSNWELEGQLRMWSATQWLPDYSSPTRPDGSWQIFRDLPAQTFYQSTLPLDEITQAVSQVPGLSVFTDGSGGGRFLSEFIGMHGLWYNRLHSAESDPFRNFAAGHIHVGIDTPVDVATAATEATLRALTGWLDGVLPVPTPGVAAFALVSGVVATRRRR